MKEKWVINNEDGSVLILSLVILALLLIIGVSATTTSNIENLVTRNVEYYTIALYRAEAAAMEAAQRLEDASPNPRDDATLGTWLNQTVGEVEQNEVLDTSYWSGTETPPINGITNSQLLAGSQGIVGGSSLDMGKSNVYGYTAYGRGWAQTGGAVIVGVGYRRAF